jgi:hypothetical protein
MYVVSLLAPEITSSTTVRYTLGTGLIPVMCVERLSLRAGTSSSISARTRGNGLINVKYVRKPLPSARHWLYINVYTLDRDPINVRCVIMILYARLCLLYMRKRTRRAARLWKLSIVGFALGVTMIITVLLDRILCAWHHFPNVSCM